MSEPIESRAEVSPLTAQSDVTRNFLIAFLIASASVCLSRFLVQKTSRYLTFIGITIESVEWLFFWAVFVGAGVLVIYLLWNQLISRFTRARQITWPEATVLALVISLFDPDGFYFAGDSMLFNFRLFVVCLIAGLFIQQTWQRLISKLTGLRPWEFRESIAVYVLLGILVTFAVT